jgi:hypothetical protein
MVVAPTETAVARPVLAPIVATDGLDELHKDCVVKSKLVPLESVPMAVNWALNAGGTVRLAGVTDMDKVPEEGTLTVALPVMLPAILPEVVTTLIAEAVMIVEPGPTARARPLLATMVATDLLDEIQVTVAVRFWVVPSEYKPVAVNCWVEFAVMT